MKLSNDFSITRLFIDKYVNISVDELQSFSILIPSLRDFYTNHALNSIYHL